MARARIFGVGAFDEIISSRDLSSARALELPLDRGASTCNLLRAISPGVHLIFTSLVHPPAINFRYYSVILLIGVRAAFELR